MVTIKQKAIINHELSVIKLCEPHPTLVMNISKHEQYLLMLTFNFFLFVINFEREKQICINHLLFSIS